MTSLENNAYEFRPYNDEMSLPKGMEHFPSWFKPLPTDKGDHIIRPTDIDGYIQSNKHNSAVMIEFKPGHQRDLSWGQVSVLKHFSTLRTSDGAQQFALVIFDPTWDLRDASYKMPGHQELRCWFFKNGVKIVEIRKLSDIHKSFENWWKTGSFEI